MARPRGGDWLEDEVRGWAQMGVQVVASALTHKEMMELDIQQEETFCIQQDLKFFQFPIQDRDVPISFKDWEAFISTLSEQLAQQKTIVAHCRMGIGRASLIAASLLVRQGIEPSRAWEWIEQARGCAVPDTPEQREWLYAFGTSREP